MHSRNTGPTLAILALLAGAGTALGDNSITSLGILLGGGPVTPKSISSDGTVILVNAASTPAIGAPNRVCLWTEANGLQPVPNVATGLTAGSLSSNGQVVLGGGGDNFCWRWSAASGYEPITLFTDGSHGSAWDINADGTVICGNGNRTSGPTTTFFTWRLSGPLGSTGAMTRLSSPAGLYSVACYAIDGAGIGLVGTGQLTTGDPRPIHDSGAAMAPLPVGFIGGATDISQSGDVIVGLDQSASLTRVFRLHGGAAQNLGNLVGHSVQTVYSAPAVSADGSVIVGAAHDGADGFPYFWRADVGLVDLRAFATAAGVDLGTWRLLTGTAVASSSCSTVICGVGYPNAGNVTASYRLEITDSLDSDGDGICDDWETNGVPYRDINGEARRYILDADGDGISDCIVGRKDVFVEVDAMTGLAPTAATLQRVVDAFAAAPVAGNTGGVGLHIRLDETTLPRRTYPGIFVDFQADKQTYFGTLAEYQDPSSIAIRKAKGKVYRYCIFADDFSASHYSGIAEGFGCNDFLVSLGTFSDGSGGFGGTPDEQAGTFMHELGHSLGLHHGGADDIGFKPNYYSVMNYLWQMPSPVYNAGSPGGTWELGYSRVEMHTLLESALSEYDDLSDEPRINGRTFPFTITGGTGTCPAASAFCFGYGFYGAPMDWNQDQQLTLGLQNLNLNTGLEPSNNPVNQLLTGHNDWASLQYNFRNSPYYAAGSTASAIGPEFSLATLQMLSSLPPPPRHCDSADFNHDGDIGTDADIQAFFACLGGQCCAACHSADFNGDGDTGTDSDIESFFRVLGGGAC